MPTGRSLDPCFHPARHALNLTVRPAYAHELISGFLSRMSRPLVTLDILSNVCRPSQTAHQQVSRIPPVSDTTIDRRCYTVASLDPKTQVLRSRLLSVPMIESQLQAAVNLPGPSLHVGPPWTVRQEVGSAGTRWRQRRGHRTVHARPQLTGKAFGYLKMVRVTTAACRGFFGSPRLHLPALGKLHFPDTGFRPTRSCVFIKQLPLPGHCDLLSHPLSGNDYRHPFYRRYGASLPSSFTWVISSA